MTTQNALTMELHNTNSQENLVEAVAKALANNGMRHFLNLETKELWSFSNEDDLADDNMERIEADPENYLEIQPLSEAFYMAKAKDWLGDNGLLNEND